MNGSSQENNMLINHITILGCGRWGSFLAWYLNNIGFEVLLWGRSDSTKYKLLKKTRENDYVTIDRKVIMTNDLKFALDFSNYIFIAINEQNLRPLLETLSINQLNNKKVVLCMKGLEAMTNKRLSEVTLEFVKDEKLVAVMLGPGQPKELVQNNPTHMLIDSNFKPLSHELSCMLSSKLIKFEIGNDIIGNEVGAALCKIIGVAGGILDASNYSALKSVLMVIGTKEIARVITFFGGKYDSAYGISCLGDYHASLYSTNSNSVALGETLIKHTNFNKHTPAFYLTKIILKLVEEYHLCIPLIYLVSNIIIGTKDAKELIEFLMK